MGIEYFLLPVTPEPMRSMIAAYKADGLDSLQKRSVSIADAFITAETWAFLDHEVVSKLLHCLLSLIPCSR